MPLALKTLETFFLTKMRNRYYRIHTSIPPMPPDTHTPLRYACGSSGSRAAPPPLGTPPPAELPIPPPPPLQLPPPLLQVLTDSWGWVASGPIVVAPPWLKHLPVV